MTDKNSQSSICKDKFCLRISYTVHWHVLCVWPGVAFPGKQVDTDAFLCQDQPSKDRNQAQGTTN